MAQIKHVQCFTDHRGKLSVIERIENFEIKRVFIVQDVPKGQSRGSHAHRTLEQILVCLRGEIEVCLESMDEEVEKLILTPGQYVRVPPLTWDSQRFLTGNDILMVLCNAEFNEVDYIRSKECFSALGKTKTS